MNSNITYLDHAILSKYRKNDSLLGFFSKTPTFKNEIAFLAALLKKMNACQETFFVSSIKMQLTTITQTT